MQAGIQSDDGSLPDDCPLALHFATWRTAAKRMGLPIPTGADLKNYVEEAGFVDVVVSHKKATVCADD